MPTFLYAENVVRNYMKKLLYILSLLTILISCETKTFEQEEKVIFKIPVISQYPTKDTFPLFEKNHISYVYPPLSGKFKFCDTLQIPILVEPDTSLRKDYVDEYLIGRTDSLRIDGLEIFPDYNSTVLQIEYGNSKGNYYPVHLVNQSPTKKGLLGKDGHVFAIQEALDSNRFWRPIEARGYDFCGNGYFGLTIHPREFVTFLMPKYKGEYETKLRVRLQIGEYIYVSLPFDGKINYNQFYLENEGRYQNDLVENKTETILYYFYGAVPLEVDKYYGLHAVWTK
jgi:hypothetical protein